MDKTKKDPTAPLFLGVRLIGISIFAFIYATGCAPQAAVVVGEEDEVIVSDDDDPNIIRPSREQRFSGNPISLNEKPFYRHVILFSKDTGTVLETWLTTQQSEWRNEDVQDIVKSDGLHIYIIGGHTIVNQLSDEVAERLKNDPGSRREHAERLLIDLGLSVP